MEWEGRREIQRQIERNRDRMGRKERNTETKEGNKRQKERMERKDRYTETKRRKHKQKEKETQTKGNISK